MKLLFVNCCISQRGEGSRTLALARAFLEAVPTAEVEEVTPEQMLALKPFDVDMLNARDELFKAGRFDHPIYDLARQFCAADAVVVAAPYWDMAYPTALRTYIEHISANGVAYHYDQFGPHGDARATRLVYLTSGGDFEREDSVGVVHWRQLCTQFGIQQFDYVFAGGLDIDPAKTPELLEAACEVARELAKTL